MDGVAIIYAFDLQKKHYFYFSIFEQLLRSYILGYKINTPVIVLCVLTQLKRFNILSHLVFTTAHYYWLLLSEMSVDLFNYPVENFQCNVALLI